MPRILHFGAVLLAWGSVLWVFLQPFTLFAQNPLAAVTLPHITPGNVSLPATAAHLPVSVAHTLSGRTVTLPAPGRLTLIVASATPEGRRLAAAWWAQANSICARHAVLDCYEAHVPSEAARALPRMTDREFRGRVEPGFWDRFALVTSHGAAWKLALKPGSASACVTALLLAPDGTVLWQASGAQGQSLPSALEDSLPLPLF
jgi:hypothetical protein